MNFQYGNQKARENCVVKTSKDEENRTMEMCVSDDKSQLRTAYMHIFVTGRKHFYELVLYQRLA